jgi:hypothetical protein
MQLCADTLARGIGPDSLCYPLMAQTEGAKPHEIEAERPLESAALALAVMSIVQGGAVFLGGSGIDFSAGKSFTVLGFGAVIGFGVREVVGWVGGVTKSMFPAPAVATAQPTSRRVVRRRPK